MIEIGQRFGMWEVISDAPKSPGRREPFALCRCDCGKEGRVSIYRLRAGKSRSCGCKHLAWLKSGTNRKHGEANKTPEYRAWRNMMGRANDPKNKHYEDYGGRGITVCERWNSYENFLADMGRRPSSKHSIEREDNAAGYSPDNCIWAVMRDQARNTRRNIVVPFEGCHVPLIEAVERMGHSGTGRFYHMVKDRIRKLGWDPAEALSQPIGVRRRVTRGES